ncbi:MAG: 2,3-bisphosphoglycerate-independent phosphoglycerate mutase, partial [Veillonella parvula]|nr:2,3-bisphosphoglycerate-independent phosphoglycerate mutase [Veillonella parvula]
TLSETLGEVLSAGGYRQLRIAETEKYAHVTYFFNGGEEEPFEGEDRILVKSPQVATYDLQPEMSAYEVTDKVVQAIQDETYDMIIKKGHLLVTADHGNAELMVNHETGKVHTAHTTNLVPLILMSDSLKTATLEAGKLCDIAPTLLDLAGIKQPKAMTGHSLVHKA